MQISRLQRRGPSVQATAPVCSTRHSRSPARPPQAYLANRKLTAGTPHRGSATTRSCYVTSPVKGLTQNLAAASSPPITDVPSGQ